MRQLPLVPTLFACFAGLVVLFSSLYAEESSPKPLQQNQRTLLLIKPNAVAAGHIGSILARVEACGLRIIGLRMDRLSQDQAETFYAEHKERPFFKGLVSFMSSGPLVAVALEGPDAVSKLRELLGATNPANALPGTIRADFGVSVQENAGHGSDSSNSAAREIPLFFPNLSQST